MTERVDQDLMEEEKIASEMATVNPCDAWASGILYVTNREYFEGKYYEGNVTFDDYGITVGFSDQAVSPYVCLQVLLLGVVRMMHYIAAHPDDFMKEMASNTGEMSNLEFIEKLTVRLLQKWNALIKTEE